MSSPLFCAHCGAANAAQATICFACHHPLVIPEELSTTSSNLKDKVLHGRYRLAALLGSGGFGAVYKAFDTGMHNRTVAVKEIHRHGLTAAEIVEAIDAFHREAQLLASLRHPNLPDIYDEFEEDGNCYLVMEFVDGVTLDDYVRQYGDKLSLDETLPIALQLCDALEYLHTRKPPVIFRDLKPSNVMRTEQGHLYLIDFGIARHFKPGQLRDTMPLGSPGYAAPEQYGRVQTDQRADIYSLGALTHFLLTGNDPSNTPFNFAPLSLLGVNSASELDTLLQRMGAIKADQRPNSIKVVRADLKHILQERNATLYAYPAQYLSRSSSLPSSPAAPVPKKQASKKKKSGSTSYSYSAPIITEQKQQQVFAEPSQVQQKHKLQPFSSKKLKSDTPLRKHSRRRFLFISAGVLISAIAVGEIVTLIAPNDEWRSASFDAVAWSPDSKYLALSLTDTNHVHILATSSGNSIATITLSKDAYDTTLGWSPDGKRLAVFDVNTGVQLWDPFQQKVFLTYHGFDQFSGSTVLAWAPDGNTIASMVDQQLQVWHSTDGRLLFNLAIENTVTEENIFEPVGLSWSGDSQNLAVTMKRSYDGKTDMDELIVLLYDIQGRQIGKRTMPKTANSYDSIPALWSSSIPYLAIFQNNTLWLLHTSDPAQDKQFENLFKGITQMAWTDDGHTLALVQNYDVVATWNIDRQTPAFYNIKTTSWIKSITWLRDGRHVMIIDGDKNFHIVAVNER